MLLSAVLGGCVHAAAIEGEGAVPATVQGQPSEGSGQALAAATYSIPAQDPRGTAYVMSYGTRPLQTGAGQTAPFLHVRISAANDSDAADWTFDAREQTLSMPDGSRVAATYAQTSTGTPVLTLVRQARGSIDLYYPVGGNIPPAVALQWQVRRGSEVIANSTPFDVGARDNPQYVEYRPANLVGVRLGLGWWWGGSWPYSYDPWFSPYGYYGYGPYFGWGYGGYWGRPYYGGYGGGYNRGAPSVGRSYGGGSGGSWRGFGGGGGSSAPRSGGGSGGGTWRGFNRGR
jgi:hypothetical protein